MFKDLQTESSHEPMSVAMECIDINWPQHDSHLAKATEKDYMPLKEESVQIKWSQYQPTTHSTSAASDSYLAKVLEKSCNLKIPSPTVPKPRHLRQQQAPHSHENKKHVA